MSVTSHLKDLLTKMGGTPKNGDSTSVLIDKIEDVYATGGGGGSSTGSNVLIANATWLLASNDPLRESFEEFIREYYGNNVAYEGRFILDKTWNEVKNAQSAMIKIQSNETDVNMENTKLFQVNPMSVTLQINAAFFDAEENVYCAQCMCASGDYTMLLPLPDGCPFEETYLHWSAANENDYLFSGPLINPTTI